MFTKECVQCHGRFTAKRDNAKYCSGRCRQRAHAAKDLPAAPPARREGAPLVSVPRIPDAPDSDDGLAAQTRRDLEAVGRYGTYQGRAAMYLARIADAAPGDTGGGHASLMKQYMAAMAEALDGAQVAESDVERLRKRAQRRMGAA